MSKHKFGSAAGHLTQWIPVGDIDIDPNVQRPLNVKRAERIGRELDPDLIGVIHVSKRANGRYVCIDGQHRIHGVKHVFGNNGTLVECKVYDGLDRASEARRFVGLNDARRPSRLDGFIVGVLAKKPDLVEINNIVRECGFRVDRNKADGAITAVGSLEDVYYGFAETRDPDLTAKDKATLAKPELLRDTLTVIRNAWGATADATNGHIISGLGRLIGARQRVIDLSDLAKKLAPYPGGPMALVGTAAGRRAVAGGRTGMAVAEVCLEIYNRGRRVGKIEPLR